MKPHKWAKEIKAWADGAEIEWWNDVHQRWETEREPMWSVLNKYRIKPQPKEPQYLYVYEGYHEVHFSKKNEKFLGFPTMSGVINYPYIGKIKLEVDDEV